MITVKIFPLELGVRAEVAGLTEAQLALTRDAVRDYGLEGCTDITLRWETEVFIKDILPHIPREYQEELAMAPTIFLQGDVLHIDTGH